MGGTFITSSGRMGYDPWASDDDDSHAWGDDVDNDFLLVDGDASDDDRTDQAERDGRCGYDPWDSDDDICTWGSDVNNNFLASDDDTSDDDSSDDDSSDDDSNADDSSDAALPKVPQRPSAVARAEEDVANAERMVERFKDQLDAAGKVVLAKGLPGEKERRKRLQRLQEILKAELDAAEKVVPAKKLRVEKVRAREWEKERQQRALEQKKKAQQLALEKEKVKAQQRALEEWKVSRVPPRRSSRRGDKSS
ncbi:hypothetical protein JCM5296_001544 [Sporobolomyces johnsonii]